MSEIEIKKIALNSSLINGSGDIYLDLSNKIPLIDINFNLEDLDLDNIWSGDAVTIVDSDSQMPNSVAEDIAESLLKNSTVTAQNEDKNKDKPLDKTTIIQDDKVKTTTLPPLMQEGDPTSNDAKKSDIEKIGPINFDLASRVRNFDLTAEIKIRNVKYFDGEIKDVDFYATVSRAGQIMVLPLVFRIPGGGIARVNGVLDNSSAVPKICRTI